MPISPIRDRIARDLVKGDGLIASVTNAPNGNISYSYFNVGADGFRFFTVEHLIVGTTLTLEATNMPIVNNGEINGKGTGAGSTTTLIDSKLNTVFKYISDQDLVRGLLYIVSDSNPLNVGLYREITDYTGATGTLTFAALPGATSTNTVYKIIDSVQVGGRLGLDPPSTLWRDVTNILTGSATHTTSGVWFVDTSVIPLRLRIKRLVTNATNSCQLILSRGR
ncbi:MAG TPA: hypothetical protein PLJ37_00555 [Chitinophagales bacterium]|nr:hypothetical protein [Chitinophagales bacterium]HMW93443.1 hypothetical protein [Chitinophagales bacterium]HMZ92934.1 hypothetical protein [Chitinophagales bacterium]HNG25876.1 hypothetical protein [Chitinophagales bacterium]